MEQAPDASRSPLLAGLALPPPLKGPMIGAHVRPTATRGRPGVAEARQELT